MRFQWHYHRTTRTCGNSRILVCFVHGYIKRKSTNTLDSELEDRIPWMSPIRSAIISLKNNSDSRQVDSVIVPVWWVDWCEFSRQNGLISVYFVLNKSNFMVLCSTVQNYLMKMIEHVSYRGLVDPSIRMSGLKCFSTMNQSQSTHRSFQWKLIP